MMETREGYLLKKQHCCPMWNCIKQNHRKSCCSSKAVIWILVLYGTITSSITVQNGTTGMLLTTKTQLTVISCILPGVYFLFPILAYLGERFNRYRIMMSGVIVTILSYLLLLLLLIVQAAIGNDTGSNFFNYAYIVLVIPIVGGNGLYVANIPQFGACQLQFASSEHLAAFARWTVWMYLLSQFASDTTVTVLSTYKLRIFIFIIVNGMYFMMLLLSFVMVYRSRHTLIIDPPPEIDGLKQIWQVMKYSWKHKYPTRRSAFTYSEDPPTRMDLAKDRYGGPFTTKQVEEVKSFWYLILIPICHFLSTGYFSFEVLAYQYTNCQSTAAEIGQLTALKKKLVINSKTPSEVAAVVGILFCQLIIVPFCPKIIPSILQRIWIGLLFLLLSSLSVMVMSFNLTGNLPAFSELSNGSSSLNTCDEFWSVYLFIVPKILIGLGQIFNLTSQLEFIFAQAPYNMQSIFIGALYTQYIFPFLCNAVGIITPAGKHWQFYVILSCLQLIVLVAFTIVKRHYKYRQCNNDSDINIRINIEDVYERDLNARDLVLNRSYQSMSATVHKNHQEISEEKLLQ